MTWVVIWLVGGLICMTAGTQRAGADPAIESAELGMMMVLYLVFWPLVLVCRAALMLDAMLEVRRK